MFLIIEFDVAQLSGINNLWEVSMEGSHRLEGLWFCDKELLSSMVSSVILHNIG
jgi:hypothetical protein